MRVYRLAAKVVELKSLVDRATTLLFYQFSDLDEYLAKSGKEEIRKTLKFEMKSLIESKNSVLQTN